MSYEKIHLPTIGINDIKKQFYTVLSVELGNTTVKSIITTTNVKNNKSFQLIKLVKLTRDIRNPLDDEIIFGHTIWDKSLSKEAIEDAIRDLIIESLLKINMSIEELDFVVRSTGVVAVLSSDDELNYIIKALSDGCLSAGIKPTQMTSPFSLQNIPQHIRPYSFFNNIQFDGSVVGIASSNLGGVAANEMESELVTAGIKLASKLSSVDYRNPVISIDMGTTLAGQIVDNSKPYSNVVCNFVGLAGGIMDVVLRGCNIIDKKHSTIDLDLNEKYDNLNIQFIHENTIKLHKFIDIIEVPSDVKEFGCVSISQEKRLNSDVKIIGSRINNEKELIKTFNNIFNQLDEKISIQIDDFYAYLIKRLIDKAIDLNLINSNMSLGITGRAGTTGKKPEYIEYYLKEIFNDVLFVEDGLALGALMMARCMNSLGTPINPMGGSKNSVCIMQERINYNKNKNSKD